MIAGVAHAVFFCNALLITKVLSKEYDSGLLVVPIFSYFSESTDHPFFERTEEKSSCGNLATHARLPLLSET